MIRVLIADDSPVFQRVLTTCLAGEPGNLGGLRQGELAGLEQVEGQGLVHPALQQALVERHRHDRRTAVLGDQGEPALLGIRQQFAGALAQIASGEDIEGVHGEQHSVYIKRCTNTLPLRPDTRKQKAGKTSEPIPPPWRSGGSAVYGGLARPASPV